MAEENVVITRVKYYKGQALTAQDFQDEQHYHQEKLRLLLQRFPSGIIRDLTTRMSGTNLEIYTGIGANAKGDFLAIFKNQTVYVGKTEMLVGENSLSIPQTAWNDVANLSKIYVNLSPEYIETNKANSLCDSSSKNNRVTETVKITFDKSPDGPIEKSDDSKDDYITIAVLKKQGDNFVTDESPVVVNAGLIKEEQVLFKGFSGHDHSGNGKGTQIDTESIKDKAIKNHHLSDDIKLPENTIYFDMAAGHDHSGIEGAGKKITLSSIDTGSGWSESNVNFDDKEGHDHSGGDKGKKIDFSNIESGLLESKIIFNDSTGHDHSGAAGSGKKIGTDSILNNSITSDKIATAPADGKASDADTAAGNGIRTSHLRNFAVTTNKIADGTITAAKIVNGSITSEKLNITSGISPGGNAGGDLVGSYPNPTIGLNAVTTEKIDTNAITTNKINDNAVTSVKIASNAISAEKIIDSAVTSQKLNSSSVTTEKITNSAITADKIANSAITADKIANGAITADKIVNGAITADKIVNGAITADKIGMNVVTTEKIINLAVTADKINDSAVTTAKIDNNAITTVKINNRAVTRDKLNIIDTYDNPNSDGIEFSIMSGIYKFSLQVSINAQLQIIPTSKGSIDWKITKIHYSDKDYLLYEGALIIDNSDKEPVSVMFRTICFGETPVLSIRNVKMDESRPG